MGSIQDIADSGVTAFEFGEGFSPRVLIIEARYYERIADSLLAGAEKELQRHDVAYDRITVPGALEIPLALAAAVADGRVAAAAASARYAGVVALGCVIRGETPHFDIVANNANHWLMEIGVRSALAIGNAILTVDTEEQAMARAQGRDGKGAQAARACLTLIGQVAAQRKAGQ